jgi:LmbE family N-acetylglucosaminyl deacetylase
VATLVAFHAHPDDESLSMGGTLARAAAEGHRTVLVVATGGEHGQVPGDLAAGETLADRRRRETEAACAALGVSRLAWLGYEDSGMTGWAQNANRGAFVNADPDEAAARLAAILDEERPEVFTTYDWHGNYGHPDHLQVHAVGHRAAAKSGVEGVYEVTMNRDWFRSLVAMAREVGVPETEGFADFDADAPADDGNPMGEPESAISHRIEVADWCAAKLQAIACHASQVTDVSYFTQMPPDIFRLAFGVEWFIRRGETGPPREAWLFG